MIGSRKNRIALIILSFSLALSGCMDDTVSKQGAGNNNSGGDTGGQRGGGGDPTNPLVVQPTSASLNLAQSQAFSISGGVAPYTTELQQGSSGNWNNTNNTFTAANFPSNASLRVTDSQSREVIVPITVTASEGQLDPAFGSAGRTYIDTGVVNSFRITHSAIDQNNKIVGLGQKISPGSNLMLVRLTADGVEDTSFSGDGRLVFDYTGYQPCGLFIQGNRIIMVSSSSTEHRVVRIDFNGNIDTNYGDSGVRNITKDSGTCHSVMDPAGNVFIGSHKNNTNEYKTWKLNYSGNIITGFGTNGESSIPFIANSITSAGLTFDNATGGLYLTAHYSVGSNPSYPVSAMAKIKSDGTLDYFGWGNNGYLYPQIQTGIERIRLVQRLANGDLAILGSRLNTVGGREITFNLLNAAGTTLGTTKFFTLGLNDAYPEDIKLLSNGKLLLLSQSIASNDLFITRHVGDGDVDNGYVKNYNFIPGHDSIGYTLIAQPDGKFVIGGTSVNSGSGINKGYFIRAFQ